MSASDCEQTNLRRHQGVNVSHDPVTAGSLGLVTLPDSLQTACLCYLLGGGPMTLHVGAVNSATTALAISVLSGSYAVQRRTGSRSAC